MSILNPRAKKIRWLYEPTLSLIDNILEALDGPESGSRLLSIRVVDTVLQTLIVNAKTSMNITLHALECLNTMLLQEHYLPNLICLIEKFSLNDQTFESTLDEFGESQNADLQAKAIEVMQMFFSVKEGFNVDSDDCSVPQS